MKQPIVFGMMRWNSRKESCTFAKSVGVFELNVVNFGEKVAHSLKIPGSRANDKVEDRTKMINNNRNFKIPSREADAILKFQQLRDGLTTYGPTMGYDAAVITQVTSAVNAFTASVTAANLKKEEARTAVLVKDEQRTSTTQVVTDIAQQIKNNVEATDEILTACGFSVSPSNTGPVQTPADLVARPNSNGSCFLRWKSNGNTKNTTFILEYKLPDSDVWMLLSAGPKLTFRDMEAPAGQPKSYRVRASRRGETSLPTQSVTIYGEGSGQNLQIAA